MFGNYTVWTWTSINCLRVGSSIKLAVDPNVTVSNTIISYVSFKCDLFENPYKVLHWALVSVVFNNNLILG